MNAELFMSWFIQLLEGLGQACIIVMDNAPYHSVVKDKAPTTANRKNEIIEWLRGKEINFDESLTKLELLAIVKQNKLAKQDASGNQKWRLVIDYRKLNEKTIKDSYPIPNIDEILDRLGNAKYFSVFDLASGFHQIGVKEMIFKKPLFQLANVCECFSG